MQSRAARKVENYNETQLSKQVSTIFKIIILPWCVLLYASFEATQRVI